MTLLLSSEWCGVGERRLSCPARSASHQGSPVRDERASKVLSDPAPTDKKAVSTNHSKHHPDPHVEHHLGVSAVSLACQVGGKLFLGILGITYRNTINQIYHWCEVLPNF